MIRKLICILLCSFAAQAVTITGTFAYPNGVKFNGYITVSLPRASVGNTCGGGIVSIGQSRIQITNGVLGSLSLVATSCLASNPPYTVMVWDQNGMLYKAAWIVPNTGLADITVLDIK